MKVLVIHNVGRTQHGPSGEEFVAQEEVTALTERGIKVTFERVGAKVHQGEVGHRLTENLRTGVQLPWSIDGYKAVREQIKTIRPDVVHFHGMLPNITASGFAACQDADVPVVQTLHNYRWLCVEGGLYRAGAECTLCVAGSPLHGIQHRCARGTATGSALLVLGNSALSRWLRVSNPNVLFLAVSDFVARMHLRGGFPPERLRVKPNGVVPFRIGERVMPSEPIVLYLGRVSRAKGCFTLLEAAGRMPDVRFRVVGRGPDCRRLKSLAVAAGLRNVEFIGVLGRNAVRDELVSATCLAVPAEWPEPFGRGAVEAMMLGVPVIATTAGALPEVVGTGGSGLLVPPADPDALVSAIGKLVSDAIFASEIGRAGRAHANRYFSMRRSVDGLERTYEELVENHTRRMQPADDY